MMDASIILNSLNNYFNNVLPHSAKYIERFTSSFSGNKFIFDTTQQSTLINKLKDSNFNHNISQVLLQGIRKRVPSVRSLQIVPESLSRFSVELEYNQLSAEDVYIEIINSLNMSNEEILQLANKDERLRQLLNDINFRNKLNR